MNLKKLLFTSMASVAIAFGGLMVLAPQQSHGGFVVLQIGGGWADWQAHFTPSGTDAFTQFIEPGTGVQSDHTIEDSLWHEYSPFTSGGWDAEVTVPDQKHTYLAHIFSNGSISSWAH